jgi:hypothetical protein
MSVTPHAQVHQLQLGVLHVINQGIIEMEIDIHLLLMSFPSCFAKHDIFSVILHNNRLSKALIYFLPKYTLDKQLRDELYADLRRAALVGVVIALPCGGGG